MRVGVLAVLVLGSVLAGCGGGGGDDAPGPGEPTPTPTVSVQATATAVPTEPAPTATRTASPEVLLATGFSQVSSTGELAAPLLLRNDGSGWERVALTLPPAGGLVGSVFSAPEVAWGFGSVGTEIGLLVRSDDAGRTWTDVTSSLPAGTKRIVDVAFADPSTGYLVTRGTFTPPAVYATHDGGATWQSVDVFRNAALPGSYALATRAAAAEVLSHDTNGTLVSRIDDPSIAPVMLDGTIAGANACATAGARAWIAFSGFDVPNDSAHTRAAIVASAAPGAPWVEQPVAVDVFAGLRAIDVRDERNGVAGGATFSDAGWAPLIVVMNDDGASWRVAPITGIPEGWAVEDVLRIRGDGAWAVAIEVTGGRAESAFLRSDDGGRTWRRAATAFEHAVRITDLARSSSTD